MPVAILPFRFPGIDAVRCAFQLRCPDATGTAAAISELAGGNISFSVGDDAARVLQNRRDLLAACGVAQWTELEQVHGDTMVFEPQPVAIDEKPALKADGMATSRRGQALLVKTADCQPVLVAHASGKYVAALHVGWRGNRILFPFTGLRAFCRHYGISPADCAAVRGPSLGPAQAQFVHYGKEWGEYFQRYLDFRNSTMDLWAMTRDQLAQAGIPRRRIYGIDLCTRSNGDLLYSYRASHACGRQGSLIWIE